MASSTRSRLVLLTAQAACLGLMAAVLVVAGNALFLTEYGSAGLPYTYIAIAVIGVPISVALARATRTWRLPLVSAVTVVLFTSVLLVSWVALRAGLTALSGLLLVMFVLIIQVGFVIIGGQAGCLFDVREIKVLFPRIVSGFAVGFMVGGLLCSVLLGLTDSTEDLLLFGVVVGVVFFVLVVDTGRRFTQQLALVPQPAGVTRVPMRTLFRARFVLLIFVYQVLSAAGTQLLDFMVFDRAAARYVGSDELAHVVSVYTATLNLIDIVFLALVAGWFMRRFGLRLGLSANPVSVAVIVVVLLGATAFGGSTTLLVFLLVAAARITDISTTDGMTRTSINAAYQVLPDADRLAVQATVEGVGVPVAIGLTGVVLIVVDLLGLGFVTVAAGTAMLVAVWALSGVLVYRGYASQLVTVLRQRAIDPAALTVDDTTMVVVDRLLASSDEGDVMLALRVLAGAPRPAGDVRMRSFVADARPAVRAAVFDHFAASPVGVATDHARQLDLDAARGRFTDPDASVRAAAVGFVGLHGTDDDVASIVSLIDERDPAIVRAALVALCRRQVSSDGGNSALQLVLDLGRDQAPEVRSAALAAAAQAPHPALVPMVLAGLADACTCSAAACAVAEFGGLLADPLEEKLTAQPGAGDASPALLRLLRASVGNAEIDAVLERHLRHPQREVQLAVLTALGRRCRDSADVAQAVVDGAASVIHDAAVHAGRSLAAIRAVSSLPADHVVRALRDEVVQSRRIVGAALALRYDHQAITRALRLLDHGVGGRSALALEMLDVNLLGHDHAVALPMLQPGLDEARQLQQLGRAVPLPSWGSADELLLELIDDPHDHWRRPWLRVCALVAAADIRLEAATEPARRWTTHSDTDVSATARWALDVLTSGSSTTI